MVHSPASNLTKQQCIHGNLTGCFFLFAIYFQTYCQPWVGSSYVENIFEVTDCGEKVNGGLMCFIILCCEERENLLI